MSIGEHFGLMFLVGFFWVVSIHVHLCEIKRRIK